MEAGSKRGNILEMDKMVRFSCLLLAVGISAVKAEVQLPRLFSSHMVLQRDRPIHIWGWSEPAEKVTVTLNGATQTATGDKDGSWGVYLPPQPAGGPFSLAVAGSNRISLEDVLVGDVWFASGQSNMEMPLAGFAGSAVIKNSATEIAQANHPKMRLLLVGRKASALPLADIDTDQSWTACTPQTAAKFSAAAYFFGRDVQEKEQVPIGLIDSSWGGTPAEAWTSLDGLSADASLMPVFAARAQMINEQASVAAAIKAEQRADAAAESAHRKAATHPWRPDPASWDPAWLFNGMVAPFVPLQIKGAIWYQGESNASAMRAPLYGKLFSAMITDWRRHWQIGNFPFLYVQIANYQTDPKDDWPRVREGQRQTLSLINTSMAVTVDVGDPHNIHPADKQSVGHRLALAAESIAYGERIEYSGPAFRETSMDNGTIRAWFDHAEGLAAKGDALTGFEIAGSDGKFVAATGRIDGTSVVLSNPQVPAPKYVRYGWQNAPAVNLYNSAGLPTSPFTSQDLSSGS